MSYPKINISTLPNLSLVELCMRANTDADPVSAFWIGADRESSEGVVIVVRGNELANDVATLLKSTGLYRSRPIGPENEPTQEGGGK